MKRIGHLQIYLIFFFITSNNALALLLEQKKITIDTYDSLYGIDQSFHLIRTEKTPTKVDLYVPFRFTTELCGQYGMVFSHYFMGKKRYKVGCLVYRKVQNRGKRKIRIDFSKSSPFQGKESYDLYLFQEKKYGGFLSKEIDADLIPNNSRADRNKTDLKKSFFSKNITLFVESYE